MSSDRLRDLLSLQEKMNLLYEQSVRSSNPDVERPAALDPQTNQPPAWAPAVDIFDDEDSLVLAAELPGVPPDRIDVQLQDHVLTLSGERPAEGSGVFMQKERRHGTFRRSFTLPANIDPEGVQAVYRDGVLKVTIAKKAQGPIQRIDVD